MDYEQILWVFLITLSFFNNLWDFLMIYDIFLVFYDIFLVFYDIF